MKSAKLLACVLLASAAVPAQAVNINLINLGGVERGTDAYKGYEIAARYWESVLTDNVTINLAVGFGQLDPGVIAQAGSNSRVRDLFTTAVALIGDQSSTLDNQAVSSLVNNQLFVGSFPDGTPAAGVVARVNDFKDTAAQAGYQAGTTRLDDDFSSNNLYLDVNTSVLKALGFTTDLSGNDITNVVDATITFNSDFNYDFNPTNGIDDFAFDFIGVAIHEMGHSLGFVSGVDIYDIVSYDNGPLAQAVFDGSLLGVRNIEDFALMSTLDLFRYGAKGELNWATGAEGSAYFSIDNGASQLFGNSLFSTGSFNGNENQASHWVDNDYAPRMGAPCSKVLTRPIGIMNPTSGFCEPGSVTALDLAAFDAMGWDVNLDVLGNSGYEASTKSIFAQFSAAVPEPSTWAMMIFGFGAVGVGMRRTRVTKVSFA